MASDPLLAASLAVAQHGVVLPRDPAEFYVSRFLVAIIALGTVLTIYSLVRYRGRPNSPLAWGLVILATCVLPPFALLLGTPLVFDRAERVEFCDSCHAAMHAYVEDMHSKDSNSLAAVHYRNRYIPRNQCYVCHTSFGPFGTFQAKLAGLADVRKYYLQTFATPIRMREPYRNEECLKCHGEAVRWTAMHGDVADKLMSGRTMCLDCHRGAHPAHILRTKR